MVPVRLLLNSAMSGANAFVALAEARGLFRAEGLALTWVPGVGAFTAATRLLEGGFDAAYGDIHALVELAATRASAGLPMAVCMVHQNTPATITVPFDSPIRQASDLAGCRIVGHASDVALRMFPVYAHAAGLAPGAVSVATSESAMADLLSDLLAGRSQAVFGYVTTHLAALAAQGVDAGSVRFLRYRDLCPDLYGSALMVSPRLLREAPQAVRALVHVFVHALGLAQEDPRAAIDAVCARNPSAVAAVESARWAGTWRDDIAPAAGSLAAVGSADPDRLDRAIHAMALRMGWQQAPSAATLFSPGFLPDAVGA
jgi:NitT/TauT family transport system substrate-binding protein